METFYYSFFWAGRKIVQIGQTERTQGTDLISVTRSRTWVPTRGEVCSKRKAIKKQKKFVVQRISSLKLLLFVKNNCYKGLIIAFLCLACSAHFATAPFPYLFIFFSYSFLNVLVFVLDLIIKI